ncbi:Maleate isomerase [Devosia sp. LC5]|uniref:maleate cis-trans isomerase family protein n=1 Tax=Devosia sp. LC5 TaxID=1502724 RepID=UPI0004E37D5A|nr:aspartate/glutamate racemase family protein [Devosia sp. LC5]KFC69915.1 Maleate isomerase [Devosia sp. LC5]
MPEINSLRIGVLTPSSNTILEPATTRMLSAIPGVSVHFSRFRVTQIALSADALAQFDNSTILDAAQLLADAKVDVIVWSGTSAAWMGFDKDERLCAEITQRTGIPAGTSILAIRDAFTQSGYSKIGLVTPYLDEIQHRIVTNWTAAGLTITDERHLSIQDNFSFSRISEATVAQQVRAVAASGCQVVAILCTNMVGAGIAAALEEELGIAVFDSVATAVWDALRITARGPALLSQWGRLFSGVPRAPASPTRSS